MLNVPMLWYYRLKPLSNSINSYIPFFGPHPNIGWHPLSNRDRNWFETCGYKIYKHVPMMVVLNPYRYLKVA
jgi:hypothetical protein